MPASMTPLSAIHNKSAHPNRRHDRNECGLSFSYRIGHVCGHCAGLRGTAGRQPLVCLPAGLGYLTKSEYVLLLSSNENKAEDRGSWHFGGAVPDIDSRAGVPVHSLIFGGVALGVLAVIAMGLSYYFKDKHAVNDQLQENG